MGFFIGWYIVDDCEEVLNVFVLVNLDCFVWVEDECWFWIDGCGMCVMWDGLSLFVIGMVSIVDWIFYFFYGGLGGIVYNVMIS